MNRNHWIDDLSTTLADRAPRRGLLGRVSALAIGLLLDGVGRAAAAKNKKRGEQGSGNKKRGKQRKGKPKPKHKPKPKPRPPCSGGACAAEPEWVDRPGQIGHCEFICEQCKAPGNGPFCIRHGAKPDGTPTKVADCCGEGQSCCDGQCVDLKSDGGYCGSCDKSCEVGEVCLNGDCVSACGPGGTPCPGALVGCCRAGKTCCNGRCVDTKTDVNHCGGCGHACAAGEACCHDRCYDLSLYVCCPDGTACTAQTHRCHMTPYPNPDGSPAYGCLGKNE